LFRGTQSQFLKDSFAELDVPGSLTALLWP
jgi:hypothetical protein